MVRGPLATDSPSTAPNEPGQGGQTDGAAPDLHREPMEGASDMAAYPHHRGSDSSGRMSRRTARRAAAAELVPSIATFPPESPGAGLPLADVTLLTTPLGRELVPGRVDTGSTCRLLALRGLSEPEAANLTATLAGLAISPKSPWTRKEINRILFLRELYASEWGTRERRPA